jgi:DNA-binding GntR family transcriptional regulator
MARPMRLDPASFKSQGERLGFQLPRVQPKNISTEVFEILRRGIAGGEIAAGTRLFEAELASRLAVSRAPIREAIRQLEKEGLVASFPRRGAFVVSLPDDETDAVYELRAEIEAKAFERAARSISLEGLEELGEILASIDEARTAGDVDGAIAGDQRFHARVIDFAGFVLLRTVWSNVFGLVRLRAYQLVEPVSNPETALVDDDRYTHAILLDALRRHHPGDAGIFARGHVLETLEEIRALKEAAGVPVVGDTVVSDPTMTPKGRPQT